MYLLKLNRFRKWVWRFINVLTGKIKDSHLINLALLVTRKSIDILNGTDYGFQVF